MHRFLVPILLIASLLVPPALAADPPSDATEPATLLEGAVVDADGNPVAGATVLAVSQEAKPVRKPRHVLSFGQGGGGGKRHTVAETVTDEEGRFALEVQGSAPFLLRAEEAEAGSAQIAGIGDGDGPVLTLLPGWTVWGQVLDKRTGDPVAGADVYARGAFTDGFADEGHRDLFKRETVTDEAGIFEFTNLDTNFYRILAVADGYSEDLVSDLGVGLEGTEPEPVYLYLVPGVTIAGTVRTGDGTPIERARVGVRPEQTIPNEMKRWARSGGFGGPTDENGEFEIRGIPVAPSYVVEIGHEDFAPTSVVGVRVREGGRSRPVNVTLSSGTVLTARLMDGEEPFRGKVRVTLQYSIPGSRVTPTVVRSGGGVELDEGRLTVRRLPTGKARLNIEPNGFIDIGRESVTLPEDEPLDLGDLMLDSGPTITGRVIGPDGKGIPNAEVDAMSFGTGTLTRKAVTAGEDGSFRFGGLPEIAFTISAEGEGLGRESSEEVKPGDDPVEIRLNEAGRIRGRVLVGDPPEPLAGFTVESEGKEAESLPFQLRMVGLFQSKATFREPTGEFVLGGLSEGAYKLKVVAGGYMDSRLEKVEVAAGETTEVGDIVLERGATVSGTIREKGTGDPVGGATVKVEPPGMFNMRAFTEIGVSSLTTGPDGRFTLSGLPPGKHTIRVEHDEYSTAKQEVEIATGVPPAEMTVEMGSGGVIEGTFRNKEGEPVVGGMVMAMLGFAPDPNTMGTTDEYGHFRIDHLAPGTYRIMAMSDPGGGGNQQEILASLQMQTAEVVDGKTVVINIHPAPGRDHRGQRHGPEGCGTPGGEAGLDPCRLRRPDAGGLHHGGLGRERIVPGAPYRSRGIPRSRAADGRTGGHVDSRHDA
jgi:protocatechuate 3,4-dioxygenase beta subunit